MASEIEYLYVGDYVDGLPDNAETPAVDDRTVVFNSEDGFRKTKSNANALSDEASESDLNANSVVEIWTAEGKKKLPGDAIAPKSVQDNVVQSIATVFVPNVTNAVAGKLYMYNGSAYKAKEDYIGLWDSSKFEMTSISDLMIPDVTPIARVGSFESLEQGTYYFGEKTDSDIRLRYGSPVTLDASKLYRLSVNQGFLVGLQFLDSNYDYVQNVELARELIFYGEYPYAVIVVSCSNKDWNISAEQSTDVGLVLDECATGYETISSTENSKKIAKDSIEVYSENVGVDKKIRLSKLQTGAVEHVTGQLSSSDTVVYDKIFVSGYTSLTCRLMADINNGLAFFDSNGNVICGYPGYLNKFCIETFRIPKNASYVLYSYYTDEYCEQHNIPKSDYIELGHENRGVGFVRATNGTIFNTNLRYLDNAFKNLVSSREVDIPSDAKFVKYAASKMPSASYPVGVAFFDVDGNYISGLVDALFDSGTQFVAPVPSGAKKLLYSCWNEHYFDYSGEAPVDFGKLEFVSDNYQHVLFDAVSSGHVGAVDSTTGSIFSAATNNYYIDIPIPDGTNSIMYPITTSGSVYGVAFLSSDKSYVGGYSYASTGGVSVGSMVSKEVPSGAKYFRFSYYTEEYRESAGYPVFNGINFENKMGLPTTKKHSFSVKLNINIRVPDNASTQDVEDSYVEGTDFGYIQLPVTYTPTGKPTPLIITCHGAGASRSTYKSDVYTQNSQVYWNRLGYAMFDMFAAPEGLTGNSEMHYGNPTVLECYKKGFDYVMKNFNLSRGVIVLGSSMGGLSSFQIVNSGMFPVVCQVANCPCIDLYKQAYCNPWTTVTYQREKIAEYFKFTGTPPTFTSSKPPSEDEKQYFIDNFDKTVGFYPILSKVVSGDISSVLAYVPSDVTTESDATEKALYDQLTAVHTCPIIVFHCKNDTTVAWRYSKYWVDMVRRSGQLAYFHSFPSGGHSAWDAGDSITTTDVQGNSITLSASKYEAYLFAKRFLEP